MSLYGNVGSFIGGVRGAIEIDDEGLALRFPSLSNEEVPEIQIPMLDPAIVHRAHQRDRRFHQIR